MSRYYSVLVITVVVINGLHCITLRGRFWHVMSAVGQRGHVAQHRHLLPSRVHSSKH